MPETRIGSSLAGPAGAASFSVGNDTYHPTECYSGHRESFLGVDLLDAAQGANLRVAIDPIVGPRLRLMWASGEKREKVVFGAADCSTMDVAIEPTGWVVNDVRDYSGHIEADCRSESGITLRAGIQLAHCH